MGRKTIYNKIKIALAGSRKSNKQLAEHLNVVNQTVSKWVTNTSQPSIQQLYKIAAYLNVKVYDLLEPEPIEE